MRVWDKTRSEVPTAGASCKGAGPSLPPPPPLTAAAVPAPVGVPPKGEPLARGRPACPTNGLAPLATPPAAATSADRGGSMGTDRPWPAAPTPTPANGTSGERPSQCGGNAQPAAVDAVTPGDGKPAGGPLSRPAASGARADAGNAHRSEPVGLGGGKRGEPGARLEYPKGLPAGWPVRSCSRWSVG